jgi:hypothetical protein
MSNYFLKESCAHNSDYRCFSCLLKFGRSGEHLEEKSTEVKVLSDVEKQSSVRKRPVLHLWLPPLWDQTNPKKPCLNSDRCVYLCQ